MRLSIAKSSFCLLGLIVNTVVAQQIVTPFVGTEWKFPPSGTKASDAPLSAAARIAIDGEGRVLFSDLENAIVGRVEANGSITVLAGNGIRGFSGDAGPATLASLNSPGGIAVNSAGELFIADTGNSRIRKVSRDGTIATIGGTGAFRSSGDNGPAIGAQLAVSSLAISASGEVYLTETNASIPSYRIRKIDLNGTITTIAGNSDGRYSGDGKLAKDSSLYPSGLAFDRNGLIYVTDAANSRIYRIAASGIIESIAGNGIRGVAPDGSSARATSIDVARGIAVDNEGSVLYADPNGGRIRRILASGLITTVAGTEPGRFAVGGGKPLQAAIGFPIDLVRDGSGVIHLFDADNARIWRIFSAESQIETVAGNGKFKYFEPDTPSLLATLVAPIEIVPSQQDGFYVSDSHRLIEIDRNRKATIIAGGLVPSCCGDGGPARDGRLAFPNGLLSIGPNELWIADSNNNRIRAIQNGVITTIMGGDLGFSGDGGPAREARFNHPTSLVKDAAGNIYISDEYNSRVRKVTPQGVISTFAGNGSSEYSGDGGAATAAGVRPSGLTFSSKGELLVADFTHHRIRAISPAGTISTWAGNGEAVNSGDGGPATQAGIAYPTHISTDAEANVYVNSDGKGILRKIAPNGTISTVAGGAEVGFSGDGGNPLLARFRWIYGTTRDAAGNLYLADFRNAHVRVILNVTPVLTAAPATINLTATAGGKSLELQTLALASSINGLPISTNVTYGTGAKDWLNLSSANTAAPTTISVAADATSLTPGKYSATFRFTGDPAGASNSVLVNFEVLNLPPKLEISTAAVRVTCVEKGPAEFSTFEIRNQGGGSMPFSIAVPELLGRKLVSVSTAEGTLGAGEASAISVIADPSTLPVGTYVVHLVISTAETRQTLPVTIVVRSGQRKILLSQSGLNFVAVAGGGAPLPQSIGVLNVGGGILNWKAVAKQPFLKILDTDSGIVEQPWIQIGTFSVSVNHSGLTPGKHYGRIEVTGDGDNSPQSVTVVVDVRPANSNPGPDVVPSSMIFVSQAGENPGSQNIAINHLTSGSATYDSSRVGIWYEIAPGAGRALPNTPSTITVQPQLGTLAPGIRRGVITIRFEETGAVRTIPLLSIISPRDPGKSSSSVRSAASCPLPTLQIQSTSLQPGFIATVGQPVRVEVQVVDECRNFLEPLANGKGAEVMFRSEADGIQTPLTHIGSGRWSGTWVPTRTSVNARIKIVAVFTGTTADLLAKRQQFGTIEMGGTTVAATTRSAPIITDRGVVHAASFENSVPIAPGSLITLYGSDLADGSEQATGSPLPISLNGTEVRIGDESMPILYASAGQVNVQVPYNLSVNTQHQITITRGGVIASPEMVNVAASRPGIFTKTQTGTGQATIFKSDGATMAEPASPAAIGEAIVIYASGLGEVNPPVNTGLASPLSPLSRTLNDVQVIVGGIAANVTFAGLAPGFSGLYQINAVVPAGAPVGDAIEVTLEVAGQQSRPVTIAIR